MNNTSIFRDEKSSKITDNCCYKFVLKRAHSVLLDKPVTWGEKIAESLEEIFGMSRIMAC